MPVVRAASGNNAWAALPPSGAGHPTGDPCRAAHVSRDAPCKRETRHLSGNIHGSIRRRDFLAMEKALEANWLPIFAGGLLVGATLIPVSEGVRDATDVCGITHQAVACQPAIVPAADLPHPDYAPTSPKTITTTVTSTATSTSTGTMPSTTVTGTSR